MFLEAMSFNLYAAGLVHVRGEGDKDGGGVEEGRESGKEVGGDGERKGTNVSLVDDNGDVCDRQW